MNIASLFTGVAGLDLAVEQATGGHVIAHAETDPGANAVLARHHPNIPNLGDATTIDWTPWVDRVDAICAGFSCQDISHAGQQAGITDDTRSGVTWGATIRAVRALRPRRVYLENVRALVVRGFDVVAADLAAAGYDFRWTCVRASDVGAPHRRDRWFAVAYPQGERGPIVPPVDGRESSVVGAVAGAGGSSAGVRVVGRGAGPQREAVADAGVDGRERGAQPHVGTVKPGQQPSRRGDPDRRDTPPADADGAGPQGHGRPVERPREQSAATRDRPAATDTVWGEFAPAITRWAAILGRPAPPPTDDRRRLNPDFVEWMCGLEVGYTDVGISRSQRLRCLGNIAVPMQAAAAYRLLQDEVDPQPDVQTSRTVTLDGTHEDGRLAASEAGRGHQGFLGVSPRGGWRFPAGSGSAGG